MGRPPDEVRALMEQAAGLIAAGLKDLLAWRVAVFARRDIAYCPGERAFPVCCTVHKAERALARPTVWGLVNAATALVREVEGEVGRCSGFLDGPAREYCRCRPCQVRRGLRMLHQVRNGNQRVDGLLRRGKRKKRSSRWTLEVGGLCSKGHPITEETLVLRYRGPEKRWLNRVCRLCERENGAAYRAAHPRPRKSRPGYCMSGLHRMTKKNTRTRTRPDGRTQRWCRACIRATTLERTARLYPTRRLVRTGHCRAGHLRTEENTGRRSDGSRLCKDCLREARRRRSQHDPSLCRRQLHKWIPQNILTRKGGDRRCRPCERSREALVRRAAKARRTQMDAFCRNGHERTPETTGRRADGTQFCRICDRASRSRSKAGLVGPKTHCKSGRHLWSERNIVRLKCGRRTCKWCLKKTLTEVRERRRALQAEGTAAHRKRKKRSAL